MHTFRIVGENKEENNGMAETWTRIICWLIHNPEILTEDLLSKELFPPPKRFFVVINPKSGPGNALQCFKNTIEPLFLESNVKYEVFVTEYAGHLKNELLHFDHTQWDAVVLCSGDGLIFEFINGLMRRPDWEDVLKLPISILPTGSGNALCATILYSAKEKFSVINAVYVLLKGRSHPMDLFSIFSRSQTFYGFLSMTWGIVSDIDIESERLRAIGPMRFTVGALQRILKLRHYKGIFSYLPASKKSIESSIEIDENNSIISLPDDSSSTNLTTDDFGLIIRNEETPIDCISSDNKGILSDAFSSHINNSFTEDTSTGCSSAVESCQNGKLDNMVYGPKSNLPDINESLPNDWKTVDGTFVAIILSSMSHLGSSMHSAPGTLVDDGTLNLQYIKKGPKKSKMLQIFTAFETGRHIEFPEVECDSVRAFRLVPDMEHIGNIAIDGENVSYEPFQGEIHPSLANIIMLPVR